MTTAEELGPNRPETDLAGHQEPNPPEAEEQEGAREGEARVSSPPATGETETESPTVERTDSATSTMEAPVQNNELAARETERVVAASAAPSTPEERPAVPSPSLVPRKTPHRATARPSSRSRRLAASQTVPAKSLAPAKTAGKPMPGKKSAKPTGKPTDRTKTATPKTETKKTTAAKAATKKGAVASARAKKSTAQAAVAKKAATKGSAPLARKAAGKKAAAVKSSRPLEKKALSKKAAPAKAPAQKATPAATKKSALKRR